MSFRAALRNISTTVGDMITLLFLLGIAGAGGMCPLMCRCQISHSSTRLLTDCSNTSLGVIPVFDVRTHELQACCNGISIVTNGTFANQEIPDLTSIDLTSNKIFLIERPTLHIFPGLEVLLLSKNRIAWLPRDVFRDTPKLRALDLSYNPLRNPLQLDIPLLDWLSLSHCDLTNLPPGSFKLSPRLENLKLDHNKLQSISVEAFVGLKSLSFLHIEGNQLTTLHPDTFKSNLNFHWLNISENMIKLNENEFFLNTKELDLLDLGKCNLRGLPPKSLSNLHKLRRLRLHWNQFLSLDGASFANFQALEDLELQDNQLLKLNFLEHLHNLTYIDLAFNELKHIDVNVLGNLSRLHTFFVTGNPLTCNCDTAQTLNWCTSRGIYTAFDDLICLETLHMSDCGVEPQNITDVLGEPATTEQNCELEDCFKPTSSSVSGWDPCSTSLYLLACLVLALCVIIILSVVLVIMRQRLRRHDPHHARFRVIFPSRSVDSETFLKASDNEPI